MREHSSRRRNSPSHERKKSKKYKKSKKSKKYSKRSSGSSSSTSYDSHDSRDYRSSSRRSRTRSSESNSHASKSLVTSSENSRASAMPPKTIDLTDDHVKEALSNIEEDKFEAKSFFSTRDREAPKKLNEKVVIDLNKETVQIPIALGIDDIAKEQIYHPNFLGDAELKAEKWLRKLYNFRQKHYED